MRAVQRMGEEIGDRELPKFTELRARLERDFAHITTPMLRIGSLVRGDRGCGNEDIVIGAGIAGRCAARAGAAGPARGVDRHGSVARLRWASEASHKRYVMRGGRLLPLPMTPAAFFTTPLFSLGAKLALLCEPFLPAGDPQVEQTIAAFVRRRLGQEFLDCAIDPFVAGIYAGDPERISVPAAFPRLRAAG